jgi:hypothetical protein
MKICDLCPERRECGDILTFGQAAVVNEEGCTGKVRSNVMPVGIVAEIVPPGDHLLAERFDKIKL